MNIFRPQLPYVFHPPKYARWFEPVLFPLTEWMLRVKFKIRSVRVEGAERVARCVREGHSVLVTPNHADHADPSLLVRAGRAHGLKFHFMAAREGFEKGALQRFILQHAGAFSVDREGADVASVKTAIRILRERRYPLVIFPEGEIYHHHESLDELNQGVSAILLKASEKLPVGKQSYLVPTVIRISNDPSVEGTFSDRMARLEGRITWKPKKELEIVERIYRYGGALLSIKEEEYLGEAQKGPLIQRIRDLQTRLVEGVEGKRGCGAGPRNGIPARVKALRNSIRKELHSNGAPISASRESELYEDLETLFLAQQLYSYPGQYLRENPTIDRIAETIFKLEEDVLEDALYFGPRHARVRFGEPIPVREFLLENGLNAKKGVAAVNRLIWERLSEMMSAPS